MNPGKMIRKARQSIGATQRTFAAWIGTSQPTLSMLERGIGTQRRDRSLLAMALYYLDRQGKLKGFIEWVDKQGSNKT